MTSETPAVMIRRATVQTYLFARALRRTARSAATDIARRGAARDLRVPVLDQLAAIEERDRGHLGVSDPDETAR